MKIKFVWGVYFGSWKVYGLWIKPKWIIGFSIEDPAEASVEEQR